MVKQLIFWEPQIYGNRKTGDSHVDNFSAISKSRKRAEVLPSKKAPSVVGIGPSSAFTF